MVHSVMAVPTAKKVKRDDNRSSNSNGKDKNENRLFAAILEETAQRPEPEPAPMSCQTTLYNRDSRMQNFHYQTREYHY